MNEPLTSARIAAPAANYALAVRSSAVSEMLHTSGIVGARPDGSIATSIGDQAVEMWQSIGALLDEGGFEVADIVSYTTYAVVGADLAAVMAARDEFFAGHRAASTLIPVPALARPEWLVEVSIVAAR